LQYLKSRLTDFDEIGMVMHLVCPDPISKKLEILKIQDDGGHLLKKLRYPATD